MTIPSFLRSPSLKKGFSAVELVIGALIVGLVIAGIFRYLKGQTSSTRATAESSKTSRSSQRARLMLADDISQSGFDPRNSALFPVFSCDPNLLILQIDQNYDGQARAADGEVIDYVFDSNTHQLLRNNKVVLDQIKTDRFFTCLWVDPADGKEKETGDAMKVTKIQVRWDPITTDTKGEAQNFIVALQNRGQLIPTPTPFVTPTTTPTAGPTATATTGPTTTPTAGPTATATTAPTRTPTTAPTATATTAPTRTPTTAPTATATTAPTRTPTTAPTATATTAPTRTPTTAPTATQVPTATPVPTATRVPTSIPCLGTRPICSGGAKPSCVNGKWRCPLGG